MSSRNQNHGWDDSLRSKSCDAVADQNATTPLGSDGVFGLRAPFPTTAFVEVLRFELMVERGLFEAATSIREEAQHEALCRIGCFGERDRHLHRR